MKNTSLADSGFWETFKTIFFNKAVLVGALGYFVDVYDLVLFGIVRVASLQGIGITPDKMLEIGTLLLNTQMAGMLVGGFLWGILGDRRGRLTVLFGSICLYSIANIANAFVTDVPMYLVCRFAAGVGLAGELGAAVTLVSEVLPIRLRGYASTLIGLAGFCGAICAALIGGSVSWQTSYLVGGAMGLVLLAARLGVQESLIFKNAPSHGQGSLKLLFGTSERAWRFIKCILIGSPIWYVSGLLLYFSPELGKALQIEGTVLAGTAILWGYVGSILGDISSGFISQFLQSRKKAILIFLVGLLIFISGYFYFPQGRTPDALYFFCFLVGMGNGYWALFVTMSAEQFGTNLRATVATSAPNLVRAATIPMVFAFQTLKPSLGTQLSALSIGLSCVLIAIVALRSMSETFERDLNYLET